MDAELVGLEVVWIALENEPRAALVLLQDEGTGTERRLHRCPALSIEGLRRQDHERRGGNRFEEAGARELEVDDDRAVVGSLDALDGLELAVLPKGAGVEVPVIGLT